MRPRRAVAVVQVRHRLSQPSQGQRSRLRAEDRLLRSQVVVALVAAGRQVVQDLEVKCPEANAVVETVAAEVKTRTRAAATRTPAAAVVPAAAAEVVAVAKAVVRASGKST